MPRECFVMSLVCECSWAVLFSCTVGKRWLTSLVPATPGLSWVSLTKSLWLPLQPELRQCSSARPAKRPCNVQVTLKLTFGEIPVEQRGLPYAVVLSCGNRVDQPSYSMNLFSMLELVTRVVILQPSHLLPYPGRPGIPSWTWIPLALCLPLLHAVHTLGLHSWYARCVPRCMLDCWMQVSLLPRTFVFPLWRKPLSLRAPQIRAEVKRINLFALLPERAKKFAFNTWPLW